MSRSCIQCVANYAQAKHSWMTIKLMVIVEMPHVVEILIGCNTSDTMYGSHLLAKHWITKVCPWGGSWEFLYLGTKKSSIVSVNRGHTYLMKTTPVIN